MPFRKGRYLDCHQALRRRIKLPPMLGFRHLQVASISPSPVYAFGFFAKEEAQW